MNYGSVVEDILKASGFSELNPVQKAALDAGLLDGKNMVLAAATASGKTLVAEMAMLKALQARKKTLYIVPLKALASEKYAEFKEKYTSMGIRVAMSVGDKDSSEPWLAGFDIIIVTSEKLDSILRHGADWMAAVGLVVADEVHLIDSPDRGPTLEVILTRLKQLIDPQILALSATISNHDEIAEWLDAVPVRSDYRPVKLYTGVFHANEVHWHPEKPKLTLAADLPPVFELVRDSLKKDKQSIVFVYTRKNAESLAEKLGDLIRPTLSPQERSELAKLSYDVSHVLEHRTKQCEKLARCIQGGAAFHHAGLVAKQRKAIEDAFRSGKIRVICATPTLAAGVNLPAYRVIIRDFRRFSSMRGMDYIPVLEVQQMAGRAGRPKYDTEGEAILISKSSDEAKKFWNEYVTGEPERILSKLGVEPVLRMHLLGLISSSGSTSKERLLDFFSKTFYAHQYKDMSALSMEIDNVLGRLEQFGFIEVSGGQSEGNFGEFMAASNLENDGSVIKPTRMGRRVAELYIDPLSANHIIESLHSLNESMGMIGILHILSGCIEMPGMSIRKKDIEGDDGESINDFIARYSSQLAGKIPNDWEPGYEDFIRSVKVVRLLNEWSEEAGEDTLMEDFGVTPGELRARIEIADWLFYSMTEIAGLLGLKDMLSSIRKARIRVKYGIREELLPFVKLRNIGRVRARALFNNGYTTLGKLRNAPLTSLTNILGPKTAKDLKAQLSGPAGEKQAVQETLEDT